LELPVFRLEGVVKTKDELTDFEGPLTLILQLLSKDKIEIRDISISLILEQYLEYLDKMAEQNLDIASEFVAMASHLMYIKTKMLLTGVDEVSELGQLISSLEELQRGDIYLQIREITQTLAEMYTRGASMMPGPPEPVPQTEIVYAHVSEDLLSAVLSLITRENAVIGSLNPREATYPQRIVFTIPGKIEEILEKLRSKGSLPATSLFYDCVSRAELIAVFVAVLELCKVGAIFLTGTQDDVTIAYAGTGREHSYTDYTDE